ncbi:MAG: hypothetical protein QG604_269 [Candidatus Dependentiae bacterium]|nr:hypothetical protein [Candidatus Dependentiae bacterium]
MKGKTMLRSSVCLSFLLTVLSLGTATMVNANANQTLMTFLGSPITPGSYSTTIKSGDNYFSLLNGYIAKADKNSLDVQQLVTVLNQRIAELSANAGPINSEKLTSPNYASFKQTLTNTYLVSVTLGSGATSDSYHQK